MTLKIIADQGDVIKKLNMDITEDYQMKLFPYAYNILGSADDARDVIQDVVLNYIEKRAQTIENDSAYLIKSIINRAITLKKRNNKFSDQTSWLPEPVAPETADQRLNRMELLSFAMRLLEQLKPMERAVFILKEAFDYSHEEISELLDITSVNSRQVLSRAKNSLKAVTSGSGASNSVPANFLPRYIDVIKNAELGKLEKILKESVNTSSDARGQVKVLRECTLGKAPVAQQIAKANTFFLRKCQVEREYINYYQRALNFLKADKPICWEVRKMHPETGEIAQIYLLVDPQKHRTFKLWNYPEGELATEKLNNFISNARYQDEHFYCLRTS